MQVSAANLLIAAQQTAARGASAKDKPVFEPLPLRQTGSAPQPSSAAPVRPGSQIDIRV